MRGNLMAESLAHMMAGEKADRMVVDWAYQTGVLSVGGKDARLVEKMVVKSAGGLGYLQVEGKGKY